MTTPQPILHLEFNELSPRLLERFMGQGLLPNFKRLHDEALVCVTDAGEPQDRLEPWIQWVTVHSGLPFAEHKVFFLGDGPQCTRPRVWDILSAHGRANWICGSMNTGYAQGFNGHLLPDPWTVGADAHPQDEFDPYVRFVRSNVQEHTNASARIGLREQLGFLAWMLRHGLSAGTLAAIARQLARERVSGRFRWQRAVLLDRLQWDVFRHYFRRGRPDFSTFFLNSTAHFQHVYWRNMEPGEFEVRPSEAEQAEYADAVLFGYRQMDRIVGQALALAGDRHAVVLSSALGQQPCLKYEGQGGKVAYRPHDCDAFREWAGVAGPCEVQPVMSEEFRLLLPSAAEASAAEAQLATVAIDGVRALTVRREEAALTVGCGIFSKVAPDARLTAAGSPVRAMSDLFYAIDGLKSGMHHGEGCLWIRNAGSRRHRRAGSIVPLTSVAPTLLALQGIDASQWMSGTVIREAMA